MADPPPPVSPDILAELATLADQLAAQPAEREVAARFEWIIETLILRGQIPAAFRRLVDKVRGDDFARDRPVVRLAAYRDKYDVTNSDVDCVARFPLCQARCCKFDIPLSVQDVEEGKLPFQVERPYLMPKDPATKMCVCGGPGGACNVYEHRPGVCREYSCKDDKRIWIDFAGRVPQPL
jgi:hypothetical protein